MLFLDTVEGILKTLLMNKFVLIKQAIEAVQITYNPDITSFENILDVYFKTFDPTDNKGQFFDRGESYEPAIFIMI